MSIQPEESQCDVNSQQSIVSANLIPTSRLHLEKELTESNTILTETTLADQYPQNESSANKTSMIKTTPATILNVLDTIVYKHFCQFHPIQPIASESDLPFTNAHRVFVTV